MIKALFSFFILANVGFSGVFAHGSVWETHGRKWTDEAGKTPDGKPYTWDDVCSNWIKEKVDTDNFDEWKGLFQRTPDCGQAANLIHLECANEFHLPFAFHGKKEFSNSSPRFNNLGAYIKYVNDHSGPETIPEDTYPVAIDRENIRPGTVLLFLKGEHEDHTLTVKSIGPLGYINFINATSPADIDATMPNFLFLTFGIAKSAMPYRPPSDGFRNWRHYDEIRGSYIPLSEEKGYSNEQYTEAFKTFPDGEGPLATLHTWQQSVQKRMKQYEGDVADTIDELQKEACSSMEKRNTIVLEGEKDLKDNRDKILDLRARSNYRLDPSKYNRVFPTSTDHNLKDRLTELRDYLTYLPETFQKPGYIEYRNGSFAACTITYGPKPEQVINLAQFQEVLLDGKVSSDANDPLDKKWGVDPSQ